MFADADFWRAFKNTLIFSGGRLLFHFPFPIIIAILMNELSNKTVTKVFQTVFTFPHFISWVVLSGILINMFSSNGIVNQLAAGIGLPEISPLASVAGFRPFIWISNIWKEFGWDGIIYLAALASIATRSYTNPPTSWTPTSLGAHSLLAITSATQPRSGCLNRLSASS